MSSSEDDDGELSSAIVVCALAVLVPLLAVAAGTALLALSLLALVVLLLLLVLLVPLKSLAMPAVLTLSGATGSVPLPGVPVLTRVKHNEDQHTNHIVDVRAAISQLGFLSLYLKQTVGSLARTGQG